MSDIIRVPIAITMHPDEKRRLYVDFASLLPASVTLVEDDDSEELSPEVTIYPEIEGSPREPLIDGSKVFFWIDNPPLSGEPYIITVTCNFSNDERRTIETPLTTERSTP